MAHRPLVTTMALVLVVLAVGGGFLLATSPGSILNPTPEFVGLGAVTLLGDRDLIAVGATRGRSDPAVVARSTDDGEQWAARAVPLVDLTGIAAAGSRLIAARYCLPASAGGVPLEPAPSTCLFASEDGGATWRDLDAGPLVDPAFADASYGWAHAQFPNGRDLFESSDGGLSWSILDRPCPADKPLVFRAEPIARQSGYLLCFAEATDASQPWSLIQRSPSGETATLFEGEISNRSPGNALSEDVVRGFSINPDGSGLMWGTRLYKTADGGHSWSSIPTPDFERGRWGDGGFVIDAENAYLVWVTTSSSSIVEYRSGILRTLITWPWSIVAAGPALPVAGA